MKTLLKLILIIAALATVVLVYTSPQRLLMADAVILLTIVILQCGVKPFCPIWWENNISAPQKVTIKIDGEK